MSSQGVMMDDGKFRIEDILFSRTDARGVIQSGNSVFQQVSSFDWGELIDAPHKIVRHPDMPKGVFHLLWQRIQSGKPMGAYICNRTKNGADYWVFATLLPLDQGYISLRLKPSCRYLDQIIPIYEGLRRQELDGTLSPEQSAQQIEMAAQSLGFADYTDFYCFALRDEVVTRDAAMGRGGAVVLNALGDMFRSVRDLEQRAHKVESTFNKTHQIPYNMRLQAGRLEGNDGPISVISANHRLMTQSLEENLARFGEESSLGADAIRLTLFKSAVARIVDDVTQAIEREERYPKRDTDLHLLHRLRESYRSEALGDVQSLADSVSRFGKRCRDMRRMMSGLELTRIMCKIERSKFDGDHAGLDEIVTKLAQAQETLGHNFDEILNSVSNILALSDTIQRDAKLRHVANVA